MNRLTKFFKQLSNKKEEVEEDHVEIKPFAYHPKIILAWSKGLEGNTDILTYLKANGFEELVQATRAIYGKEKSRNWLMKNGYPHLMAMIRAYEDDENALEWLRKNRFALFYNMAKAIMDEDEGFLWINKNSTQEIYYLTKTLKHVKEKREEEQYFRVNKKRIGMNDE